MQAVCPGLPRFQRCHVRSLLGRDSLGGVVRAHFPAVTPDHYSIMMKSRPEASWRPGRRPIHSAGPFIQVELKPDRATPAALSMELAVGGAPLHGVVTDISVDLLQSIKGINGDQIGAYGELN